MQRLFRFRLRSFLVIAMALTLLAWWVWIRPRETAREQLRIGRALIHNRDQSYLRICFDEVAKERLITVVGDSRLTHWGRINWLAAPSANRLVSFSEDGSLLFWNRNDGSIQRAFYDIASASYCSEARLIAMSDTQGHVHIWSCETDSEVPMSWNLPPSPNPGIMASPDANYLIQFGLENSLVVWNRETGQQVGTIPRTDARSHIEFCPASKRLMWADSNQIHAYELATASLAYSIQIPPMANGGSAAVYANLSSRPSPSAI